MLLIPCDIPALGCGCFFKHAVEGGGQAPDKPGVGQMGFEVLILSGQRGVLEERQDGLQCRRPRNPAGI